MTVILPKRGSFAQVEDELGHSLIRRISQNATSTRVALHMPRLKHKAALNLVDTLRKLGITHAFSDLKADLSGADGRSCGITPGDCLHISRVSHKAFVKMDEDGAEAAASTAVQMLTTSAPTSQPPAAAFIMNRPFIYLIRDRKTDAILFTGRVTRMTEETAGDLPQRDRSGQETNLPAPTQVSAPRCDRDLMSRLKFQRTASDAKGIQSVVRHIQRINPKCARDVWNPQVDDTTASWGCWYGKPPTRATAHENNMGHTRIPLTLYEGDSPEDTVRLTSGRDAANNIIIYWSNQPGRKTSDGSRCWLYYDRVGTWDLNQ